MPGCFLLERWVDLRARADGDGAPGAEVAARLSEEAFFYLDAPVARIAAPDVPAPYAPALERVYVPGVEKIIAAARELVQ